MKFFLDTANLDEIRQGAASGVIDGITTNPTLAAKEKKPFRELIIEICNIVKNGAISAEVVSTDYDGMLREARQVVVSWQSNVVAKIPINRPDHWRPRPQCPLQKRHPRQRHPRLFRLAGASRRQSWRLFRQPVSRQARFLNDISQDSMILLRDILQIYRAYDYKTQVLAASLRHPMHVVEAAKMGAHIGTTPFKAFETLFEASAHGPGPRIIPERLGKSARYARRNFRAHRRA